VRLASIALAVFILTLLLAQPASALLQLDTYGTTQEAWSIELPTITAMDAAPDGIKVAVGAGTTEATLIIYNQSVEVTRVEGLGNWITDIQWSPDSKLIAVSVNNPDIVVVVDRQGQELWRTPDLGYAVTAVSWSWDGSRLAVLVNDPDNIIVYDRNGRIIWQIPYTDGYLYDVSWSPDGSMLAVAAGDHVAIFDSNGTLLWRLEDPGIPRKVEWGPQLLAVGGYYSLTIYNITPNGYTVYTKFDLKSIGDLDWWKDGSKLALLSYDDIVVVDVVGGVILWGYSASVKEIDWTNDGKRLVGVSSYYYWALDFVAGFIVIRAPYGATVEIFSGEEALELRFDYTTGDIITQVVYASPGTYAARYTVPIPYDIAPYYLGPTPTGEKILEVEAAEKTLLYIPTIKEVVATLILKGDAGTNVTVRWFSQAKTFTIPESGQLELYLYSGNYTLEYSVPIPSPLRPYTIGEIRGVLELRVPPRLAGQEIVLPLPSFFNSTGQVEIRGPAGLTVYVAREGTNESRVFTIPPDNILKIYAVAGNYTIEVGGQVYRLAVKPGETYRVEIPVQAVPGAAAGAEATTTTTTSTTTIQEAYTAAMTTTTRRDLVTTTPPVTTTVQATTLPATTTSQAEIFEVDEPGGPVPALPEGDMALLGLLALVGVLIIVARRSRERGEPTDTAGTPPTPPPPPGGRGGAGRPVEIPTSMEAGAARGAYEGKVLNLPFEKPRVEPLEKPLRVGPFEARGLIGMGGFATTLLAVDGIGRSVALKLPHEAFNTLLAGKRFVITDRARRLLEREFRALKGLNHPHVIRVEDYGIDEESGAPYLALEYCSNGSLRGVLEKAGRLDPWTAGVVAYQIASALAYLHSKGIVHRDLKPENVLFTGDGLLKVSDFNIAKFTSAATAGRSSGVHGYTPGYAAPEQIFADMVRTGPYTDIWALGVMLYEMLVGEPPFDPVNYADALKEPPDLSRVPEPYRPLLARMLAFNPADRPGAGTVMAWLERILSRLEGGG